jgi:hypothetical protein
MEIFLFEVKKKFKGKKLRLLIKVKLINVPLIISKIKQTSKLIIISYYKGKFCQIFRLKFIIKIPAIK